MNGIINMHPNPVPTEQPRELFIGREISIRQQNGRGYLIQVGCQSFAIEKKADMLKYVNMYLNDPKQTEELFFSGKLFDQE